MVNQLLYVGIVDWYNEKNQVLLQTKTLLIDWQGMVNWLTWLMLGKNSKQNDTLKDQTNDTWYYNIPI